ncbi:MAG: 1,3-beta-galactosyl-N-acetylhexosamine phosphorylase N-terminal domain-containing protein, partial [Clostridiaceae bacterium]|nr:1,3-beta-galactosyl-N-acetylhexosamine phosphorylase N-terminal domain-containing protein [Clostridiaceae bacterium]
MGGFTLPGESGYESLTLRLAEKWGADVIRDSDGTVLSDSIMKSGYGIYSTICIIRDHNEWAKENIDKLQQSFLMSHAVTAESEKLEIKLLDGYFAGQFYVNDSEASIKFWQVFDRTENTELPANMWVYCGKTQTVAILNAIPWHNYTVNFLAYRVWEEISMYNHITNNWDKEHLLQIDPVYPQVQDYMLEWLE